MSLNFRTTRTREHESAGRGGACHFPVVVTQPSASIPCVPEGRSVPQHADLPTIVETGATPETDAAVQEATRFTLGWHVPATTSRRLERQRNEALLEARINLGWRTLITALLKNTYYHNAHAQH